MKKQRGLAVFMLLQAPVAGILFCVSCGLVFGALFLGCKAVNGPAMKSFETEQAIIGVVADPKLTDSERAMAAKTLLAYNEAATNDTSVAPFNSSQVRTFTQVAASGKIPAPLTPPKLKHPSVEVSLIVGWNIWCFLWPFYLKRRRRSFFEEMRRTPWPVRAIFWIIVIPRISIHLMGFDNTPEATGPD